MTVLNQAVSAAEAALLRPSRRRGFCPACRGWHSGHNEREFSPPALIALGFLVLAAIAWALTIRQSRGAGGAGEMAMGSDSLATFATGWLVMMAAMMLPTMLPLVYEFARRSERRRRWWAATGVLAVTYLSIWLAFGVGGYFVLSAFPVPRGDEHAVGGLALALAGLYVLTPIQNASEARCRELCSLHGSLPFNLARSAMVVGARYALSCLGCSAGLMVAMLVIGMANLAWVVIVAALVLVYKLGPAPSMRRRWLLSALLVVLAVVYWSGALHPRSEPPQRALVRSAPLFLAVARQGVGL